MTTSPPFRQLSAARRLLAAALTVVCAGLLWACPPDLSCRELGCDPGFTCNSQTGDCQRIERDCTTTGCPSGQVCDRQTGSCRSAATRCPAQPCSAGQVCNTQTGFCQSEPDCAVGECPSAAEKCNESTGECIPRPCDTDVQCPKGHICGPESTCAAGCRLEAPSCPADTFCRSISGRETGQCLPECKSDNDCPFGQICAERDGRSACQTEPPCRADEDCRADEVCRNATCGRPPCKGPEDCPGDQICDRPSGTCVGADCREDMLAPNHDRGNAHPLDFGSFAELRLCPARDDWFSIEADSAEAIEFRLEHDARRDPDIQVFSARGRLLGANQQPPPREAAGRYASTLKVTSHRRQALFVRILAADRYAEPPEDPATAPPEPLSYDLTIRRADALICSDDGSEENDRRQDPTSLTTEPGVPSDLPYQICDGDEDWFELADLKARQGLRTGLTDAADHLRLDVLAPDGTRRRLKAGETVEYLRIDAPGDWYLRATSARGRSGSYHLLWEISEAWDCKDRGKFDSREQARMIPAGQPVAGLLCPYESSWEVDWLALDAPTETSTFELTVDAADTLPPLEISIFRSTDEGLELLRRAARKDGEYRAVAVVEPQPLFVRIHSNSDVGRLDGETRYRVSYEFRTR